ncbi:MAG: undecaprenyldiphospho-muramoylpentapeptide beta-N-acetylglucosaminyltransferase [Myxococcota bacterium]|nr:undecaprenyldiphospho-muramoylpentapeptide beta-N-acetylglucosaminyltransferase [Myxococcota bacterium]
MSRRVVIAGGGTGGHLFPGVAVAEELGRLGEDIEVSFVGTEKGIESRVIPRLGYQLDLMDVQGLKGGGIGKLKGALKLPAAGLEAMALVRKLKPSLVVSVGGYAAGPFTMCAAVMGVPTVLLEQNSVPGVTNRALGKVVKRAFLTYEESKGFFPGSNVEVVGNPLRRDLLDRANSFTYKAPKPGEKLKIMVLGGSGGSLALNQQIPGALCDLGELAANLQVTHQVGKQNGDLAREVYFGGEEGSPNFAGDVEVVEFIEDMASAYEDTHLMICRAGATTIAEVLAFGLPAIYIPFPGAADDHQTSNALALTEQGAGVMVPQSDLESNRLQRLLEGLIQNPESLANMAIRARALGRPEAGEQIARECLALMKK